MKSWHWAHAGKLGCIAKEYDFAASSACGALENIVVDSAETARGCVTFLREKAHGVATFLILDAQKGLRTEAPSQPPEGEQPCPPPHNCCA